MRSRSQRIARVISVTLVVVMVALLAFLVVSGIATSAPGSSQPWAATSLLAIVAAMAVVGLVVAGHQPGNPIGWILAGEAVFVLLSVAGGACANMVYRLGYRDLAFAGPPGLILNQLFSFLLAGFPLVILLFPDGRLPSRGWRWALRVFLAITRAAVLATIVGVLVLVAGHHVELQSGGNLSSFGQYGTAWVTPVVLVFILAAGVFWLAAVVRQALSWRRSADERRQQLKWLAAGAAVCGVFGIWAITTDSALWELLILGFIALPVSIGIGIMKYRLYDIDRIISRTLAYAIVTGLLIGLYAGLVLLATQVLHFHGSVAVAAATLAAAALFSPLRRRVQHRVDRRFNRARYDTDRTVTVFAAQLQDTVDLDSVRTDLTDVVGRALEPAHVSLWINERL